MENNDNKGPQEIKDVPWTQVTQDGEIKFRRNNKRRRVKGFFKGMALVMVAAVTGGVTSAYIVNRKYSALQAQYNQNNQSLFEQSSTKSTSIPKNNITKVAEIVGPTVVGISNNAENFFGKSVTQADGSGIIFDKRGYIVTNYHVIEGADNVSVKLANSSKPLQAKFVGADPSRDIAVIKIDAQNLPVAKFGDSSKVSVGDEAIAIGNPLGEDFAGSVTAGIISAVNRQISMRDDQTGQTTLYKVLQTDAAINPGNSGGALCNEAGEIIGINSLKIGSQYNAEGMGFAITINEAKTIIQKIMNGDKSGTKNTTVSQAVLGITGGTAVPEETEGVKGVYVAEVMQGMGAAAAGIKAADIIVEADKTKIETMEQLKAVLSKHKPGDSIACKVWRDGKVLSVNVILSENKQ